LLIKEIPLGKTGSEEITFDKKGFEETGPEEAASEKIDSEKKVPEKTDSEKSEPKLPQVIYIPRKYDYNLLNCQTDSCSYKIKNAKPEILTSSGRAVTPRIITSNL